MLAEGKYFTVAPTACTIRSGGALAIYCGDLPKKNPDGTTTHSLAAPLLLMPQEMWGDPTDTMAKIAGVLNDNAHLFFSSAKPQPDQRASLLREARDMLAVEAEALRDGISVNGVVDPTEEATLEVIQAMEDWIARASAALGESRNEERIEPDAGVVDHA
ncbi:hypothetical protein DWF04_015640 [Cereibacter sphaeroides f. sp. denitrificans]|nr:hypothetical protein DWF04_16275 [Cereibacter sphaeroides f. sp. denitrificans]